MKSDIKEKESYEYRKRRIFIILDTFPKSKNGEPYLRMKNWKRVFFRLFLRKYGIDGTPTKRKYTIKDVTRRMQLIQQFKRFFCTIPIKEHDVKEDRWIIEGEQLKAIIIRAKRKKKGSRKEKTKYELLSIFPIKK